MEFLGGNPWDWLIIFVILTFAVALGIKENDETVVPKSVIIRAYILPSIILIVLNIPRIISFLT